MPAVDLSLANIEKASRVIDPVFRNSPQFSDEQLNAALGRRVLLKVETVNPIRSFKGRGASFRAQSFERGQHAVCASAGNFGQAVAYAGRSRGIPVTVFVPEGVNPARKARMEILRRHGQRRGCQWRRSQGARPRLRQTAGRPLLHRGWRGSGDFRRGGNHRHRVARSGQHRYGGDTGGRWGAHHRHGPVAARAFAQDAHYRCLCRGRTGHGGKLEGAQACLSGAPHDCRWARHPHAHRTLTGADACFGGRYRAGR